MRATRGQPVVISEFGGLSLAPAEGEEWFGYATVPTADEYLERFAELVDALLDSPEIAGFCYTQLTDTEQERNGLLTADRSPKLDPERVRAIVERPARAVPSEEVEASRSGYAATRGRAEHVPLAGQASQEDNRPTNRQRLDESPRLLEPRPSHRMLTTVGCKTGEERRTPVTLVYRSSRLFLVAPYGPVGWVRNARAAGTVRITGKVDGDKTDALYAVREVTPLEAGPVLKDYWQTASAVRSYFDVPKGAPVEAFVHEAHHHPVFELTLVKRD